MTVPLLRPDHGDGAGVRVTPETLRAVRSELATLVLEAEELHRQANFGRTAADRAEAAEQAEEADDKVLQYLSHVLTNGGRGMSETTRILVAPCGCIAGADVTDSVPGFCRSIDEAREDVRNGFTEGRVPVEEYRVRGMGCSHEPQWGVES